MDSVGEAQILQVLQRYVSPINARVVLRRAYQRAGITGEAPSDRERPALLAALQIGIRLFVATEFQSQAVAALSAMGGDAPAMETQRVPIGFERDIKTARALARRMAEQLGGRSFTVQRAVTAVSELVRNIVNYTPGGELELTPLPKPPPRIRLVATDTGAGIPHIEEVLSGRYRSRTGLGRGILGVRELASTFDIHTDAGGTRIEVELAL